MEKQLKSTYSIDNSFEYKFSILDCLFKQRKLFKECLQYRDVQFISSRLYFKHNQLNSFYLVTTIYKYWWN